MEMTARERRRRRRRKKNESKARVKESRGGRRDEGGRRDVMSEENRREVVTEGGEWVVGERGETLSVTHSSSPPPPLTLCLYNKTQDAGRSEMRSSFMQVKPVATQQCSVQSVSVSHPPGLEDISPSEEVTDTEDNDEEDLGVLDDQRSIILHLLSQLKLGMDLTRVVLPTFILEKRSLLEMYANFMAHPDMFLSITAGATAEDRIIRFVEYYLTAFHEGRKGAVAKKPYNPVLGETFHCSWEVPRDKVKPSVRSNQGPTWEPSRGPNHTQQEDESPGDCYRVRFVAEQSKFMGMSIGVSMVGEGVLCLLEHDEEYVFTLPCAYARSILTVPWVELGGKVSISCVKSGYSATVTFHTKPFYGGKVHRVTAEVKHNPTNTIVCKAQGEWNGTLEFTYSSGETKVIDTAKLPVTRKKLRPSEQQGRKESRCLWQHVTKSLKEGNIDEATEHKHRLEERQRGEERKRAADNKPWTPKYFTKEGDGWIYNNSLWKST
ncbi:unnamed protein product [Pleuronectes platessa]|uniref:Oxysterol-binding protein n=1 Tax=Pleuronectes platessa TaxID=8262 RepID=A0A9N7TRL3_PLEPL|nr:unnamed protein product [Pleuronectes platessa]